MELAIVWKVVTGIAKKIPWKVWAFAGVVLIGWSWGEFRYHQGEQKVKADWKAAVEAGKPIVASLKAKQNTTTVQTVTVYKDRVKVIHEKADTIIKLVPQYIPADSCMLPGGFRLLHDAAATNAIPETPGGVNDVPASVQEVTATVVENYATCQVIRSNLISLESWVQQQYNHYLELCKQQGVRCNEDN